MRDLPQWQYKSEILELTRVGEQRQLNRLPLLRPAEEYTAPIGARRPIIVLGMS